MKTIEDIKKILITSNTDELAKALNEYNVNEHDKFGNDIFHYYLINAKELTINYKDFFNLLIKRGVNVNSKQPIGQFQRSYLQLAVVMNLKEIFDFLISKGADVNSTDANGNSMLFNAVMSYWQNRDNYGYYIKKLLDKGANPFQKNNYGHSAYSLAFAFDNSDVKKYFEHIKE
jgi:ankyrin repeat protein